MCCLRRRRSPLLDSVEKADTRLENSAELFQEKTPMVPWPESNQHSLRNSILSRARLPSFATGAFGRGPEGRCGEAGGAVHQAQRPRRERQLYPAHPLPDPRRGARQQADRAYLGLGQRSVAARELVPGGVRAELKICGDSAGLNSQMEAAPA